MAGEVTKTPTIFSSLAKNSVKFFSQKGFTKTFYLHCFYWEQIVWT